MGFNDSVFADTGSKRFWGIRLPGMASLVPVPSASWRVESGSYNCWAAPPKVKSPPSDAVRASGW